MTELCKNDPLGNLNFIGENPDKIKKQNKRLTKKQVNNLILKGYRIGIDQARAIKIIAINENKNDYEVAQEAFDDLIKKKKKQGII